MKNTVIILFLLLVGSQTFAQEEFSARTETSIMLNLKSTSERKGATDWTRFIYESSEVDANIPSKSITKENAYAIVIGNRNYRNAPNVDFAINDAFRIKEYLVKVFGYPERNVTFLPDATQSDFRRWFGTSTNAVGALANRINSESEVFVYYAGHGGPGKITNQNGVEENGEPFFLPIDSDPNYMDATAYPSDVFYKNLSQLNAKNVTVVVDACFSGLSVLSDRSAIYVVKKHEIPDRLNVLSSSEEKQTSQWYRDKKHGLFTYYFLKSIQDKYKTDANRDGELSFNEIFEYVSNNRNGVPAKSREIFNEDQNPVLSIPSWKRDMPLLRY